MVKRESFFEALTLWRFTKLIWNSGHSGRNNNFAYYNNKNGRTRPQILRDQAANRSNGVENGNSRSNSNSNSSTSESKAIIVRNLHPLTIAATLKDYFETHYKRPSTRMEKVYLNLDDNDDRTGNATVAFE